MNFGSVTLTLNPSGKIDVSWKCNPPISLKHKPSGKNNVYIYMYKCTHAYMHTHTHIHTYIHTYTHTHVYTHVHTHIHMYTCIHVNMHTYICTHAYINRVICIHRVFGLWGIYIHISSWVSLKLKKSLIWHKQNIRMLFILIVDVFILLLCFLGALAVVILDF